MSVVSSRPTPDTPASQTAPATRATVGHGAIEWPTVAVAAVLYAGFGLITWHHQQLPWWLVALLGGYLVAWHGSLQHEVIHGHPTPWPRLNRALVWPVLWLWCPYEIYRESHERHHETEVLTDPERDPESFYVSPAAWDRMGTLRRTLLVAHNSLLGRLLLGPPVVVARLAAAELPLLLGGDRARLRLWAAHALSVAAVLAWVRGVCGIPVIEYVLLFVYPAISFTLLRSYAEHSAAPVEERRTACVECAPPLALLYLNNNLHLMHHSEPWLPWYRLPSRWRERRAQLLGASASHPYAGYLEVFRHHLLRVREPVRWPLAGAGGGKPAHVPVGGASLVAAVHFAQAPHGDGAIGEAERADAERSTGPGRQRGKRR
ncbi:MAG: fatty acid desaturase [Gammaproteobacteria bacterium]|nr:fatty acid desaturase [Gammaproteobacteria bacterium]